MKEEIELEDRCGYYAISRAQRKTEIKRGMGRMGTMGYQLRGCYDCDGNKDSCGAYFNPLEEYLRGKEKK